MGTRNVEAGVGQMDLRNAADSPLERDSQGGRGAKSGRLGRPEHVKEPSRPVPLLIGDVASCDDLW